MGEHTKINPGPFIEFLNNVCPAILGAPKDEISRHFASLEMMNKVRHFIYDDQDTTFFIARELVDREDKKEDGKSSEEKEYTIITENEVVFRRQACAVALLKRSPATFRAAYEGTLEEGAVPSNGNFASHLQLLTMGAESEWSPFELVHLYLQNGFAPLFNAVAKQSESANKTGAGDDDREEIKVGVPNVMRKIMDLSMALMQCQQNVDIENISLPIDPEIAEAFEKAKSFEADTGLKPAIEKDAEMFSQNMSNCQELFRVWKDEVGQFRQLVREQLKKRGNERPTVKINCEHEQLQAGAPEIDARIEELQKFRRHHMKLQEIIERVLVDGKETGAKAEVAAAYQLVEQVDVLDVSRRGQQDTVAVARMLRDKLGAAKTATEMFRVFSRFNALFVRPRIRRAIQEYQSSLIQQVKEDVHRLQEKFKETYEGTQACKLTAIRGLPPTAGLIVWARPERWENHVDGKNLKQEGDAFARKTLGSDGMKTSHIFDEWLADTKDSKKFDVSMRIFDIQQGYQTYLLLVNFDEQIITLFKEVRNLQALGDYRVPYAIKVNSDEAKQNYPFAMTLQEAARTYMQTCAQIKADHQPLMASIESYTQKLSETVFQFQQKFTELESMAEQMSRTIDSLDDVNVRQETSAQEMLLAKFEKMQKTDMNLASFSNMDAWVQGLNKQIEQRLVKLLAATSAQWLQEFKRWPLNGNNLIQACSRIAGCSSMEFTMCLDIFPTVISQYPDEQRCLSVDRPSESMQCFFTNESTSATAYVSHGVYLAVLHVQNAMTALCSSDRKPRSNLQCWSFTCSCLNQYLLFLLSHRMVCLSESSRVLEPQKEFAMTHWVKHFHDCLGMVCNLPLLQAARFDALKRGAKESAATHKGLIALLDQKTLIEVYDHVSSTVEDMQAGVCFKLDAVPVQSRVKAKYDQWHRDLLNSFGEKVREAMSEFFRQVNQGRERLEAVDGSGDLTVVCMAVKTSAEKWSPEFEELQKAQKLLVKQRFQFPEDWMHIEQVQGEWEAFEQILTRRNRILDHELPKLRSVLVQKDKQLEESITQLYAEWSSQKPVQGGLKPTVAMQAIKDFDERLLMLREQHSQLVQLKKSLQMEVGDVEALAPLQEDQANVTHAVIELEAVAPLTCEEMGNLKDVWSEINTVHSRVETLKETLWTAVEPKRIKHALEDLLSNMKQMDRRLQQYEAFDHIQEQLQAQIKLNQVVAELKTDALKERHWKQIVQMLKLSVGFNELTLGHLWDSNLEKHQPAIKEMLARAQGEMGLEQFLAEVREKWSNYDLELVPYKSKCRLIRSWDDLFSQLDEHLQSIQSMKMSPYYKSFEDEGATWDDRLNKIRIVFDLWMDVQRRWVYLEGIFGSSADIQQLLPNEFARFKTIDSEFVGLMKKVLEAPRVFCEHRSGGGSEVDSETQTRHICQAVGIEGVQKQLDRLSDMLTAVQKALGDYLEKQRSQFARFYFVGDEDGLFIGRSGLLCSQALAHVFAEDLLEMIGNSKDVAAVSRHLAKMFAGLSQLSTDPSSPELVKAFQPPSLQTSWARAFPSKAAATTPTASVATGARSRSLGDSIEKMVSDCARAAHQAPTEACHKRIDGKEGCLTRAEGKTWHPECFRCVRCGEAIASSFFRVNGELRCHGCQQPAAGASTRAAEAEAEAREELPTCRGCRKAIREEEPSILADKGDRFHERCFVCAECGEALTSYVILQARKYQFQECPYYCEPCADKLEAKEAPEGG
eukprot:s7106_g1.t3